MECKYCGAQVEGTKCLYCGAEYPAPASPPPVQNVTIHNHYTVSSGATTPRRTSHRTRKSSKSKGLAVFLACLGFIGLGGLNRFYVGKHVSGTIYLLTIGLCWIGTIVDLSMLSKGTFTDAEGRPLR